jgi:hypothetical protein
MLRAFPRKWGRHGDITVCGEIRGWLAPEGSIGVPLASQRPGFAAELRRLERRPEFVFKPTDGGPQSHLSPLSVLVRQNAGLNVLHCHPNGDCDVVPGSRAEVSGECWQVGLEDGASLGGGCVDVVL